MYTDPTGHWQVAKDNKDGKNDSDRSPEAQAQILEATKEYSEAKARGDTNAMNDAHQKAEDARNGNIYQNSSVSSTSIANELSSVLSSSYVSQDARNDARTSDVGFVGSTASSRDPEIRNERNSIVNTINQARKDSNILDPRIANSSNSVVVFVGSTKVNYSTNIGYRYVSKGEYDFIMDKGYIPNTDEFGNPKNVYVSTNKYNNVSDAESGLMIGSKNPNGATKSPMYRVEFKLNSVEYNYQGDVEGGTGRELTTKDKIYVDTKKITPLEQPSKGDDENGPGGGSGGDQGHAWDEFGNEYDENGNIIMKGDYIPVMPMPINPVYPPFPVYEPFPVFVW